MWFLQNSVVIVDFCRKSKQPVFQNQDNKFPFKSFPSKERLTFWGICLTWRKIFPAALVSPGKQLTLSKVEA